jgi:hypothetical protein
MQLFIEERMIFAMTAKDTFEVAAAVIASLGGGGAVVYAMSGFLGKLWADRALEKQKQDYAQLNIAFNHQLELATRRVQIELDTLGHLHKLRTETELEKIRELWRRVASLRAAYFNLPKGGYVLAFADEALNKKMRTQASLDFSKCLSEVFEIWSRELLSIPEKIAQTAEELITIARREELVAIQFPDPYDRAGMASFSGTTTAEFFDQRDARLTQFKTKANELLSMMRIYQQGPREASPSDSQPAA